MSGNIESQNYENSLDFSFELSDDERQDLANSATFEETPRKFEKKENPTLLSKEDFKNYFEGENFQQRNIGNCRLLGPIDSLVSFGDYEKLIRENVIKDDKGYTFYLPLGAPHLSIHKYFVSYNELKSNQVNISGQQSILVTGKQGIRALVHAYGKMSTGKQGSFDYNNLEGGSHALVFKDLVYGINVQIFGRISNESVDDDPNGTNDEVFKEQFYNVLESFDSKYDMLTLGVNQLRESDLDRQNIEGEAYSSLGHYSKQNHVISVEKVKKSNGTLIVTVSNPRNSNRSYDITFENLIKSCGSFVLGTKKEREGLITVDYSYRGERQYVEGSDVHKIEDISSVNHVVQLTGEENDALRKARGDILVSEIDNNSYEVSSYNLKMYIKERNGSIIIYNRGIELSIDKSKLSNKYIYNNETVENDQYPLLLYGAKIANFINRMRDNYINPRKWDKSNKTPFRIINGSLQFDDDPSTNEGRDLYRRTGAELLGDDYIECLKDWTSLGISNSDISTKQKIANLLNQFVERKRTSY